MTLLELGQFSAEASQLAAVTFHLGFDELIRLVRRSGRVCINQADFFH